VGGWSGVIRSSVCDGVGCRYPCKNDRCYQTSVLFSLFGAFYKVGGRTLLSKKKSVACCNNTAELRTIC
jgi:hypothetical protein